MKRGSKSLILLPLLALVLSGCHSTILEDMPVDDDSSVSSETTDLEGDSSLDSNEPDNPEPIITYSLVIENKQELSSISVSDNDLDSSAQLLSISLITYEDNAIVSSLPASEDDVSVSSSNEDVVKVEGLNLLPQSVSGESLISASWLAHPEASDTFTMSVSYTPYTPVESFDYKLSILDKEDIGSTWKITDTSHTFSVKLYEYKYLDGVIADDYPSIVDAKLSDVDISFSKESILGVASDSISFFPKAVGTTTITITWKEHTEAFDSIEISVEEVTYEYGYALQILNGDNLTSTDESPWRVGDDARTLEISLTSTTYVGSLNSSSENTLEGTSSNVSVSITGSDGEASEGLTNEGLILTPHEAGAYLVTASWIGHEEANQTIDVLIKESVSTTYTMSVSTEDRNKMEGAWYLEDETSRSFSFEITPDDGEGVDLPYKDSDIEVSYSPDQLQIQTEVSAGVVTVTPLGIDITEQITLTVSWSLHPEASVSLNLTFNQHVYEIKITNGDALSESWTVAGESRTAEVALTKDGSPYEQSAFVELEAGGDNPGAISVNGLSITPLAKGSATVTAIWYKFDPQDPTNSESNVIYATSDPVQLSIEEDTKPASISLSLSSITFNAYDETQELTATVLDSSGNEATEQGVTWSADNEAIVIEGSGNTVTIGVSQYNVSATLTCTSQVDVTVVASCSVSIGAQPDPDGPQQGDSTYKLGAKIEDTYIFFDGTASDGFLGVTTDWDEAADVFITPNKYEIGGNGCTLSFYDANDALEYLAATTGGSEVISLSTSSARWNWETDRFVAPADNNYYLGSSDGQDIRMCASNDSSNPIVPYSDVPEDYESNSGLIKFGTFDWTGATDGDTSNNQTIPCSIDQMQTTLDNHWQGESGYEELSFEVTSTEYMRYGSNSAASTYWHLSGSLECITFGNNNTAGHLNIQFDSSIQITAIDFVLCVNGTTDSTFTVNDESQTPLKYNKIDGYSSITSWDQVPTTTFESFTPSNLLEMTGNSASNGDRVAVHSITIYGELV